MSTKQPRIKEEGTRKEKRKKLAYVITKFRGGLQVRLYPGGPSTASRPFQFTYQLNFLFIDTSIWWQDALGYVILTVNVHREESSFCLVLAQGPGGT